MLFKVMYVYCGPTLFTLNDFVDDAALKLAFPGYDAITVFEPSLLVL